ncbi:hypothetical protein ACFQWB_06830 [Paenibacillus thermoaerophilus]|uniref:DUF1905 domain-containing protein n=1 Tax=Paenibacillus thermoaerophilus TaxID=1215385 RepID=A0ABW2V0H5_9BACL|nr:hypothetical protein [Paenibacillus thermoaerophilus]
MLGYLVRHYDGTVIVPMTVVDPRYFAEIAGKLRGDGAAFVWSRTAEVRSGKSWTG